MAEALTPAKAEKVKQQQAADNSDHPEDDEMLFLRVDKVLYHFRIDDASAEEEVQIERATGKTIALLGVTPSLSYRPTAFAWLIKRWTNKTTQDLDAFMKLPGRQRPAVEFINDDDVTEAMRAEAVDPFG